MDPQPFSVVPALGRPIDLYKRGYGTIIYLPEPAGQRVCGGCDVMLSG
jgi:hypothetical protein